MELTDQPEESEKRRVHRQAWPFVSQSDEWIHVSHRKGRGTMRKLCLDGLLDLECQVGMATGSSLWTAGECSVKRSWRRCGRQHRRMWSHMFVQQVGLCARSFPVVLKNGRGKMHAVANGAVDVPHEWKTECAWTFGLAHFFCLPSRSVVLGLLQSP